MDNPNDSRIDAIELWTRITVMETYLLEIRESLKDMKSARVEIDKDIRELENKINDIQRRFDSEFAALKTKFLMAIAAVSAVSGASGIGLSKVLQAFFGGV